MRPLVSRFSERGEPCPATAGRRRRRLRHRRGSGARARSRPDAARRLGNGPYPSYVSLWSALHAHGCCRRSARNARVSSDVQGGSRPLWILVVHRIAPEVFGGYEMTNGVPRDTAKRSSIGLLSRATASQRASSRARTRRAIEPGNPTVGLEDQVRQAQTMTLERIRSVERERTPLSPVPRADSRCSHGLVAFPPRLEV